MSETNAIDIDSLLGAGADPVAAGVTLRAIAVGPSEALPLMLSHLGASQSALRQSDPAILGGLLRALHAVAVQAPATAELLRQTPPATIAAIDAALPPATANRHLLLHLLSLARAGDHLVALAVLLSQRPPANWMYVGQVLSPLMQYHDWDPADFFPQALDALAHPSAAAPVLDLANYLTRNAVVDRHPAAERVGALIELLGGVTGRLGRFEQDPRYFGESVDQVQAVLSEAVALAVSLCDALGLIGDTAAVGKLNQAMQLLHRRVQTEAAGALARLGDEGGRRRLLELAGEPSARLRVLAYAEELGIVDAVDESYLSETARAEAEMALWLSQPQQMGVPPTAVEVIDSRRQFWPSFETPVDCYLVHFTYNFGDTQYTNVGMTGPVVHAFAADVADLPLTDIYAAFAGWHADHPDIFAIPATQWNAAQRRVAEPLIRHLQREGLEQIEPLLLGFLLDEQAVVVRAVRDGTEELAVTDGLENVELATAGRLRPLTAEDAWNIYKGRKILRTFNG